MLESYNSSWMVQCLPCKPIIKASIHRVRRCHSTFSTAACLNALHVYKQKPMFSSAQLLLLTCRPLTGSTRMTAPTYNKDAYMSVFRFESHAFPFFVQLGTVWGNHMTHAAARTGRNGWRKYLKYSLKDVRILLRQKIYLFSSLWIKYSDKLYCVRLNTITKWEWLWIYPRLRMRRALTLSMNNALDLT